MEVFESSFKDDMSQDEAVKLGLTGLKKASDDKMEETSVEVCLIKADEKFRKLDADEIKKYVKEI